MVLPIQIPPHPFDFKLLKNYTLLKSYLNSYIKVHYSIYSDSISNSVTKNISILQTYLQTTNGVTPHMTMVSMSEYPITPITKMIRILQMP